MVTTGSTESTEQLGSVNYACRKPWLAQRRVWDVLPLLSLLYATLSAVDGKVQHWKSPHIMINHIPSSDPHYSAAGSL